MKNDTLTGRLPRLLAAAGLPVCLALALLLAPNEASAQRRPGHTQAAEQACTPDVMRLCGDAIPNQNRIIACLKQKRRQLSADCAREFSPRASSRVAKKKKSKRSRRMHRRR